MVQFKTIDSIKNWLQGAKNAVYKRCLVGIPIALGAGLSFYIAKYLTVLIDTHAYSSLVMNGLLSFMCAIFFFLSSASVCSVITIMIAIATKLGFVTANNFKLSFNKDEAHPLLVNFELKEELINLLLALALINKNPNHYWLNKNYIEYIESLFTYNFAILEETSFKLAPQEIQDKILKNVKIIETTISFCGVEIMKKNYANSIEFKVLLEEKTIYQKYEALKEQEHEEIEEVKAEASLEEQKKQKAIAYLENIANEKMQKTSCLPINLNVEKEKPKYLSL